MSNDINPQEIQWGESLDVAFFLALMSRLRLPVNQWEAKKLGLIDNNGNVIREPKTAEERRALTNLDRFALEFLKVGRGRVPVLYNLLRQQRANPDFVKARTRAIGYRFLRYFNLGNMHF